MGISVRWLKPPAVTNLINVAINIWIAIELKLTAKQLLINLLAKLDFVFMEMLYS